jgi:choline dehydrogenase
MGVPNLDAWIDPEAPTCFGTCQRRIINSSGRRCSTYHAFLPESLVRRRRNLTIVLGSHVQQILLSNDIHKLRATGLVVEGKDQTLYTVRAKHEIIVCAGAIVTPQLLLLRYTPSPTV